MFYKRTYQLFEQQTPSHCFLDFAPFLDLWRSKFTGDDLPSWSEFAFEDFEGWYGQLSLGKFTTDNELHMILWGTTLTEWWGFDFTNKPLGFQDESIRQDWCQSELKYLHLLCETNSIGIWQGNLEQYGRDFINIRCIDLPLVQDGRITHILSAYIKLPSATEPGIDAVPSHDFNFLS